MSAPRTAPPRVSRSPNGCNAKPIWVALQPEERREIEAIADREARSVSATTRLMVLRGLEEYRRLHPSS